MAENDVCGYYPETIIKLKLWGLIAFLGISVGSLISVLYTRGNDLYSELIKANERITKIESIIPLINYRLENIDKNLEEIKRSNVKR